MSNPSGGDVVGPDDPRYDLLGHADNYRFVARPDHFVLVHSTEQVLAAVSDAVRAGRRIAARSGGHCGEAFVADPDVEVVIDLSPMSDVRFVERRGAFLVEAGATVGRLSQELYRNWGVTLPLGFCMGVGAGGHIVGGGYGPLSRTLGLSVDYLDAVEVVVVDEHGTASAVVATPDGTDAEQDLWWAHTGGGGGTFGIVTRYWMRTPAAPCGAAPEQSLPRPPRTVHVVEAEWSWPELTEQAFVALAGNFLDWQLANSAPDAPGVGLYAVLRCLHRSAGSVTLHGQIDAGQPGADALVDAFLADLNAGVDVPPTVHLRTLPWLAASRYLAVPDTGPWAVGVRRKVKSADLCGRHRPEQLAAAYRHLADPDYDGPASSMEYIGYGGRVNETGTAATAIPRESLVKVFYMACWSDPAQDDRHLRWIRELYRDMHAATGGAPVRDGVTTGAYVNYADVDLADREWNSSGVGWPELYWGENYPRLQRAKTRWDPADVFRHALSVRVGTPVPAPAAARR